VLLAVLIALSIFVRDVDTYSANNWLLSGAINGVLDLFNVGSFDEHAANPTIPNKINHLFVKCIRDSLCKCLKSDSKDLKKQKVLVLV
jgi:hypothetical protein